MREETKELLEKHMKSCSDLGVCELEQGCRVGLGVTENIIQKMEEELALKFSDDYIEFLSLYGEASLLGFKIFGYASDSMHKKLGSVVKQTVFYGKSGWPGIGGWYVVSSDSRGNPIGCKPDGSVWLSYNKGRRVLKLANSFDEFLYNILTDTKYKDVVLGLLANMDKKDQYVILQVCLDSDLFLEFSEHQDEDECIAKEDVIVCQKKLISLLEKLSPEGKKIFSDFTHKYAKKNSDVGQKKYLEKISDVVGSV